VQSRSKDQGRPDVRLGPSRDRCRDECGDCEHESSRRDEADQELLRPQEEGRPTRAWTTGAVARPRDRSRQVKETEQQVARTVPSSRAGPTESQAGGPQWQAEGGAPQSREEDRMRQGAGNIPWSRTPKDSEREV